MCEFIQAIKAFVKISVDHYLVPTLHIHIRQSLISMANVAIAQLQAWHLLQYASVTIFLEK